MTLLVLILHLFALLLSDSFERILLNRALHKLMYLLQIDFALSLVERAECLCILERLILYVPRLVFQEAHHALKVLFFALHSQLHQ